MLSKNVWRSKMLETRSQLGPDKAAEFNRQICKNLLFVFAEAGVSKTRQTWASYKSFKWEADPNLAVLETFEIIDWAFPRLNECDLLDFYIPQKSDALWVKNKWGIWEPDPRTSKKIEIKNFNGILVPGLAFDKQGRRLGYGKGYYDKALSGFKGLKVGISYSLQVAGESLPNETNDVLMDLVVTESETIKTKH
ncbi:MAG: 5-formyltetrahydrofolate cyclo-ligase [Oligoflexia bacterium]|nr:5-formyltetrahydrofolate cyclo-ligase [Oligoflexia bacterium]